MKENWKWYVYIIQCKDDTYYTGMTRQHCLRYDQHVSKMGSRYTAIHGAKKIAYIEEHENIEDARNRERQIKDWSREKKEMLIKGEWKKEW